MIIASEYDSYAVRGRRRPGIAEIIQTNPERASECLRIVAALNDHSTS